jgi:hypothetical protein
MRWAFYMPKPTGEEVKKQVSNNVKKAIEISDAKHARSITQYCKKFNPEKSVLTSLDEMTDRVLPLYAFWKFKEWIKKED